ncbi:alpha-1,3-glucosidase [Aureococcus anophagefferens]|nr:alpha-1,3-glucosidase [Aureococcus anophagefferens]
MVMFSDDDDEWHAERVATYARAAARVVLVSPRYAVNDGAALKDHAQRPQHAARLNAELAEEVGEGLAGARRSRGRSWFAAAYEAGMGRRIDAARIPVDALVGAYRDRVLAAERPRAWKRPLARVVSRRQARRPGRAPALRPRADPAAVVVSGSFRCTVLTDRLLRFEYAKSGAFEDRATTAFVHRRLPVPTYETSSANGTLTVRTKSLVVTWDERGEDLSSLAVAPAPGADSGFGGWRFGDGDPKNLLGTIRSLDELGPTPLNCTVNKNITVHDEGLHCAWGLVSRSGWAAVDDAETFALDGDGWWRGPNRDDEDVMLFAHGFDYKGALKDFIKGIDYWWIDWQQGGALGGCAGRKQNPTIWTARLRSTDHARRGSTKRGLVLSRWGGLGSHRYPVGFSGDVATVDWHTLAYQPYFSATAANVAYGFWSHDVVSPGFGDGASTDALEVYARWVQWAAYSGVVRSHDRGLSAGDCDETFPATRTSDACGVVEPWGVPAKPYFAAIRAALKRRGAGALRATRSREAYDAGLGPLRPLYYEFPRLDAAYGCSPEDCQYFFGPDLVVAPVVAPASGAAGFLAPKRLWIPPGVWVEETSGRVFEGAADGSTYERRTYGLAETPVLVRGGAVLPTLPPPRHGDSIGAAGRPYAALVFSIYPGADRGAPKSTNDGATTALRGASATLAVSYARTTTGITVTLATEGAYAELPSSQDVALRFVNAGPVSAVAVNGAKADWPFRRFAATPGAWTHEGDAAVVRVGAVRADGRPTRVDVAFAADGAALAGRAGFGALDRLAILGDDPRGSRATRTRGARPRRGAAPWRRAEVKATQDPGARTAHVLALLDV